MVIYDKTLRGEGNSAYEFIFDGDKINICYYYYSPNMPGSWEAGGDGGNGGGGGLGKRGGETEDKEEKEIGVRKGRQRWRRGEGDESEEKEGEGCIPRNAKDCHIATVLLVQYLRGCLVEEEERKKETK